MPVVYSVTGMTCDHCKQAVEREVSAVEGVLEATVDLEAGTLTVTSEDVTAEQVAAAVDEAGYELT